MLRTILSSVSALSILCTATAALADETPDPDHVESQSSADATGMVGTLSLAASMQVGSGGSETEISCARLGSSCSSSGSMGGAFLFSVGYMWKHVGFDVMGGLGVDGGERRYTSLKGGQEAYTIERAGGLAAIRLRGQIQNETFRGALALGPGVAFRAVGRAESFPSLPEDVGTYASPAFTLDVSGQWRMGKTTSLVLGAMLWVEDAGAGVKGLVASNASSYASQAAANVPGAYASQVASAASGSDFRMVSGMQASVMPYLGLQFGP